MACLGPFDAGRRLIAGVSGGPDSMALALLLSRWGAPRAVVVDHALRPESAAEATLTVARLALFGVSARIVRLHLVPGPDLGARARAARYSALLRECRDRGCPDLVLGHHAQDQSETVLLRGRAGSGPAGLAGMAAASWRGDARLLRPLLGIAPSRLRATLWNAGVEWIDDPTNTDPSTARGALRSRPIPHPLAGAGEARMAAEAALADELAHRVAIFPTGHAEVRGPLSEAAWSALVWTISGRPYPPPRAATRRLARHGAGTLHGVVVRAGIVAREPAAMAGPGGREWDGRFVLEAAPDNAELGALDDAAGALRRRPGPPVSVLRTFPAVRLRGKLFAVPHLAYPDPETCRSVRVEFRPARPLSGAPFASA